MRKWFQKFNSVAHREEAERAALKLLVRELIITIKTVKFFKRDEITTDLICCDIEADDRSLFFHEEMSVWDPVLTHLKRLQGFDVNWFSKVSQPAFETCLHVAYQR